MGTAVGIVWLKERWATAQRVSLSMNNVFHLFRGEEDKMSDGQQALVEHADSYSSSEDSVQRKTHPTLLRLNRTHMQSKVEPLSKGNSFHEWADTTQSQHTLQVSVCCSAVRLL